MKECIKIIYFALIKITQQLHSNLNAPIINTC